MTLSLDGGCKFTLDRRILLWQEAKAQEALEVLGLVAGVGIRRGGNAARNTYEHSRQPPYYIHPI
jgi:hypothetical protein